MNAALRLHSPTSSNFIYERRNELSNFSPFGNAVGYGLLAVATAEKQTHFVLNIAVAGDGDCNGIRHFSDWIQIPTDGLLASGDGSDFLWYWSDRSDHPCSGVVEAALGDLDGFTTRLAQRFHAAGWTALDL